MFKSGVSLGKRLTLGFTVIIAIMAVLAIWSASRMAASNTEIGTIVNNRYPKSKMEQTTGIERVNKSIVRMDEVTQQNAAMVQEADNLSNAISVFKLGADGDQNHIADVQTIGHDA